ncbi:hypothetical protein D083_0540 [Dickeya solani RNS 08.23.3.1.A]|nr:hypothetical protein D083_0540 [Dickeya solani RNS 08.23.3.1.A]
MVVNHHAVCVLFISPAEPDLSFPGNIIFILSRRNLPESLQRSRIFLRNIPTEYIPVIYHVVLLHFYENPLKTGVRFIDNPTILSITPNDNTKLKHYDIET